MKNNINRKSKIIRILLASSGLFISLILVISVTGYLILKNYISKMNLINLDNLSEAYDDYDDEYDEYYENEEAPEKQQYLYGINDNMPYSYVYLADKSYKDYLFVGKSNYYKLNKDENVLGKFQNNEGNNIELFNEDNKDNEGLSNDNLQIYKETSNDNIIMSTSDIAMMQDKDVFNILLVGSDRRDSKTSGRSDVMMILSINKKKEKIILTSFLRDIFVEIPGKKSNRLNVAYSAGGPSLLIKTFETNFRIKIDRYASVDFISFINIVDAIGGIDISITEEELPIFNDYIYDLNYLLDEEYDKDILNTHGNHILNGKQALAYCRIRYIGTDFARTGRQREVLEQIFNKVKSSNLSTLNDLLNSILPMITTNLEEGEIISHVLSLKKYLGYDISQWSVPMAGTYKNVRIRNMAVLDIDFNKNIKELDNRVY